MPDVYAGEGTSNVKLSQTIKGLKLGPTYHFRIAATNSDGTTYGADHTFTTITSTSWVIAGQEPKSAVTVSSKGSVKVHIEKVGSLRGRRILHPRMYGKHQRRNRGGVR